MNLATYGVVVCGALALAGCSGGGGSGQLTDQGAGPADAAGDLHIDAVADPGGPPDASNDAAGPADAGPDALPDASEPWTLDPRDPVEVIPAVDPASFELPTWPSDAAGDLLISEAGFGCLSVARGQPIAAGSEVLVDTCRGREGQRWVVDDSGVHPDGAPALCLDAPDGWFSAIELAECEGASFVLGADGVIAAGDVALDVTWEIGDLIAYGKHGGPNQRWRKAQDDVDFLQANADHVVSYPFAFDDALSYQIESARARLGSIQPPYPAPAPAHVAVYPGEVAADAPMASRRVHFDRTFDHDNGYLRVAWPPQHWQSTGLYAAAGALIIVVVPDSADAEGLFVRINVHTDVLEPTSSNVDGNVFQRPPSVALRVRLDPGVNAVRSIFGGTLVLESTIDTGEVVPVEIHGAVAMPRYVRHVTTPAQWLERRELGAPWAEIESDRAVITVPSSEIRDLHDPERVSALYDQVVSLEVDLFALAEGGAPTDRPYSGKARFVEDTQITAGWGHSGFPIVASIGWDLARLGAGGDDWGVWHELGHNHQQFCLWSARFGTESTVNLFSLYVQESLGQPSRIAEDYAPVSQAVANGTLTFDQGGPWEQLVFLSQPVLAFEDRWEIYRRVHRAYRALSDEDAAAICADEAAQIGNFFVTLSQASGHDLRDHFAAWGIPVGAAYLAAVSALGLPAPASPVELTVP